VPASHNFQHATEIGACTHEHGRQNDDNASRKLNSLRSRSACTSWTQEVQAHPTLFLMVQSENSEPLLQQHCPETEVIPNTGPLAPWPPGPLRTHQQFLANHEDLGRDETSIFVHGFEPLEVPGKWPTAIESLPNIVKGTHVLCFRFRKQRANRKHNELARCALYST